MKKVILASVLGIGFSGLVAFGQGGQIYFNNYDSTVYNPVIYGLYPGLPEMGDENVDDPGVELQLFYAYGTITDVSTFMAAATPGVTTFINVNLNPTGDFGTPTSIGSPGGYYNGPNQLLPDWVPGETVTFMVEAWQTTGPYGGPTYATAALTGRTGLWTETGATTGNDNGIQLYDGYPPRFFAAGPPVLVLGPLVPEPATLAFASLSFLTLLTLARWKKV